METATGVDGSVRGESLDPLGHRGANRNDVVMLEPTLDAIADNGLLADIGTLTLDRSYDYPKIRNQLHARGLIELDIQRRGTSSPWGWRSS